MYKPLFTNIVMIAQKKEKVQKFLENPKNMLKWDTDISFVDDQKEEIRISRLHQSLNDQEVVTIERAHDEITYHVQGDRLNYQVMFEFAEENGLLEVSETLLLPEKTNSHLPLKLLKPIAKHAFARKLENLATISEQLQ